MGLWKVHDQRTCLLPFFVLPKFSFLWLLSIFWLRILPASADMLTQKTISGLSPACFLATSLLQPCCPLSLETEIWEENFFSYPFLSFFLIRSISSSPPTTFFSDLATTLSLCACLFYFLIHPVYGKFCFFRPQGPRNLQDLNCSNTTERPGNLGQVPSLLHWLLHPSNGESGTHRNVLRISGNNGCKTLSIASGTRRIH